MKITQIKSLAISAIKVVRFARFTDFRGYFTEPFRKSDFSAQLEFMKGVDFFQFNESFSRSNVVRGLHFQWNPFMENWSEPSKDGWSIYSGHSQRVADLR
jgi:dTDP-4-dehydrorhamnose 3,5-epimerase